MGAGESIHRYNKELKRENKELLYKIRKLDKKNEKQSTNIIIINNNDKPQIFKY